jgi:hypothetical protein
LTSRSTSSSTLDATRTASARSAGRSARRGRLWQRLNSAASSGHVRNSARSSRQSRPRSGISAGTVTDLADAINITSLVQGDYITVDIDQAGSTTPGSDLTVMIEYVEV